MEIGGFWNNVTVLKKGKEIQITVNMFCPHCGGDVPFNWQGSPLERYPVFNKYSHCMNCKNEVFEVVPEKSIIRWWYLAKLEIQECWRQEESRYILPGSGNKCKNKNAKRKISSLANEFYEKYRRILQDERRRAA
jgi:hypothetical protein